LQINFKIVTSRTLVNIISEFSDDNEIHLRAADLGDNMTIKVKNLNKKLLQNLQHQSSNI